MPAHLALLHPRHLGIHSACRGAVSPPSAHSCACPWLLLALACQLSLLLLHWLLLIPGNPLLLLLLLLPLPLLPLLLLLLLPWLLNGLLLHMLVVLPRTPLPGPSLHPSVLW